MRGVLMRFFCAAILLLAALPAWAGNFNVGVLFWSMNIPGQVAMRQGLEADAERINAQAAREGKPGVVLTARVAGDGETGIENQIHQMRELIGRQVDIIIVQPTDNAALSGPLKEANKAGIPVVAYDQYISGGTLAAYRTSDNFQAGFLGRGIHRLACAAWSGDPAGARGVPPRLLHRGAGQRFPGCPAPVEEVVQGAEDVFSCGGGGWA